MFSLIWRLLKNEPYKIPPFARALGFVGYSQDLESRYKKNQGLWQSHIVQCRSLISSFFAQYPSARHLHIIGSAHLIEFDRQELIERFDRITLIDIVHPPQIVKWAAQHKEKVELKCLDVSGVLESLSKHKDYDSVLAGIKTAILPLLNADLIISANLISQLHLLPMSIVERKSQTPWSIEQKDTLATASAEKHLAWLAAHQIPVLIYGDRQVTYKNQEGVITYSGSYPVSWGDFKKITEWNWHLAPLGEVSPLYSLEMKVEAYQLTPH